MAGGAGHESTAPTVETRMVVEYGITLDGVWLPLALLRRLAEHGPWSPPYTEATADQERVLISHALAERHNGAGLHRGPDSRASSPPYRSSRPLRWNGPMAPATGNPRVAPELGLGRCSGCGVRASSGGPGQRCP